MRHPEHEKFLEESWLFEGITETYLPLLHVLNGWLRDGLEARLTVSLSPTLCGMLRDPLLCERYARHLDGLIDLAEKEIHRTHWDRAFRDLAWMYHNKFMQARELWRQYHGDLVQAFRLFQDAGVLEIITTAATHGLLPLLASHPPSVRAQILTARDHYRNCFGRDPAGIWLPECAYRAGVEEFLQEANIRWFILDTHGLLHATPRPRYSTFAPIYTPNGVAAFGRDFDSSRQVWSKHEGYPGDPRYRDFYRDIGFDLDFDYVRPHLPSPDNRGFTGIKYYRITGAGEKQIYERDHALATASEHARHFLDERVAQVHKLEGILDRPPIIVAPYDAELFGHWWYEGPEFLDFLVRKLCQEQPSCLSLFTPGGISPAASHQPDRHAWRLLLGRGRLLAGVVNESNEWIYPHLQVAQERMTELARQFPRSAGTASARHATSRPRTPPCASQRLALHSTRQNQPRIRPPPGERPSPPLHRPHEQLMANAINESWLAEIESRDNLFPDVNWNYWR